MRTELYESCTGASWAGRIWVIHSNTSGRYYKYYADNNNNNKHTVIYRTENLFSNLLLGVKNIYIDSGGNVSNSQPLARIHVGGGRRDAQGPNTKSVNSKYLLNNNNSKYIALSH